ncbi:MAG: hypothetical protein MJZ24_08105, partial [Paludibacteraceae bacterium]|nr:hypothetical protein [Paludibacteraceae bacterium]
CLLANIFPDMSKFLFNYLSNINKKNGRCKLLKGKNKNLDNYTLRFLRPHDTLIDIDAFEMYQKGAVDVPCD